jgi:hypothetical protein
MPNLPLEPPAGGSWSSMWNASSARRGSAAKRSAGRKSSGGSGGVVPKQTSKEGLDVKHQNHDWHDDFPLREDVEDFAGKTRTFVIDCHETALGFTVRAREQGAEDDGYEFAAYSETSPYSALGRLRQKMYRGLATRHITGTPGSYRMLHDSLRGRIASDGHGGVLLVVDGVPLSLQDIGSILSSHEGFSFALQIVDALE